MRREARRQRMMRRDGRGMRIVLASLVVFAAMSGSARAQDQQLSKQPSVAVPQAPGVAAPSPDAQPPIEPVTGSAAEVARTPSPTSPQDLSPWGMFQQADIVVKAVMIGLAFASIVTWTLWLGKGLELAAAKRKARSATRKLQRADSLFAATGEIGAGWTRTGPIADLVRAAEREETRSSDLSIEGTKERLAIALSRIEAGAGRNMARGTGLLATIGATAPFVGLFGTVWGIMNAFIGISHSKTTNLAVVAPGIAEALLATALGLVAAIPAVIIYNVFVRAIAGYRALLSDASGEVLQHLSRDLERQKRGTQGPEALLRGEPVGRERHERVTLRATGQIGVGS